MYKSDPVPEIQRLEQLVESIRQGLIRLPRFQRPFVWDRQDMLDLWDSIYKGYPIGSVLLWHSSQRLKSEREIYGFSVQEAPNDTYPTNYLLDGQQRLTTVCGALFWDGSDLNSVWAIHFDLDTEQFVYAKEPDKLNLFPLNKLLSTSDFVRQCMRFESSPLSKQYYKVAENLLRAVKNYKVAVVRIGDLSLKEVAPIFERINSKGRSLTMVDLMRAATWRDGFDLTEAIEEVITGLGREGFSEIPETVVLRGVSAAASMGINKDDIDRLRDLSVDDLRSAFAVMSASTRRAIEFLRQEMGITHYAFLPYAIQLTHTAEFFRLCPNPSAGHLTELARWLWITSVTKYFSGASTGQNSRDLQRIREFATSESARELFTRQPLNISSFLYDRFNLRTASSTTFCLLLKRWSDRTYGQEGMDVHVHMGRKVRDDFWDLFEGTPYAGLNIGQSLPEYSQHERERLQGSIAGAPEGAAIELMVQARSVNLAATLEQLTGQPCQFAMPSSDLRSDYAS